MSDKAEKPGRGKKPEAETRETAKKRSQAEARETAEKRSQAETPEDVDIYEAADRAIREMNLEIVRDFGRLKIAKFDELNILRTVTDLYRTQAKKAKRRYYEVGFEAYLLGLFLCGVSGKRAYDMAEKAVTRDWIEELMEETNFVMLYRFNTETERKAQRLAETLSAITAERKAHPGNAQGAAEGLQAEIDRAMRAWSKQVAWYAIHVTDAGMETAYDDAGLDEVQWYAEKDERTCSECRGMDGKIFPVRQIPAKPHPGCRCRRIPIRRTAP